MPKSPIALAAALVAAVVMLASSAEAGFGIRLGFGGPLPSFMAHGHGSYHAPRHYHHKRYLSRRVIKKEKEKAHVAKRKVKAEPKVAKKAPRNEPKVAIKRKAAPEAKVAKKEASAPKRVAVATPQRSAVKESAENENSSITSIVAENVIAVPVEAESGEVQLPQPKPTKAASKLDCKKFFPSVGMTLTVPCE